MYLHTIFVSTCTPLSFARLCDRQLIFCTLKTVLMLEKVPPSFPGYLRQTYLECVARLTLLFEGY